MRITAKDISAVALNTDATYRPHYTGRGMLGDDCVGIVTDKTPFEIAAALALHIAESAEDLDDALDALSDLACLRAYADNMGTDTIVYFPSIHAPEIR